MKRKIFAAFLSAVLAAVSISPVYGAEFFAGTEDISVAEQDGYIESTGSEFSAGEDVMVPEADVSEGDPQENEAGVLQENDLRDTEDIDEFTGQMPDEDSTVEIWENVPQENSGTDNETEIAELPEAEENVELAETEEFEESDAPQGFDILGSGEEDLFSSGEMSEFSDGMAAVSSSDITFSYDSATATLTLSGSGRMDDYNSSDAECPWGVHQYEARKLVIGEGITSVGSAAFYDFTSLVTVTLPSTMQELGEGAFADCYSLTEISLPEGLVKIGDYAFQDTLITSLRLPATLTQLSNLSMFRCSSLKEIIAASGNSVYASADGILFSKDMSTLVCYPSGKPGESYSIPQSVKKVGEYAFYSVGLQNITIPGSVEMLGEGCFYMSGITSLVIPDSVKEIGDWICSDCASLKSVRMGSGLKKLAYQVFQRCYALETVEFGKNVTDLDYQAFSYCTSLKEVAIPEGVTYLMNGSFGECTSLTTVHFPSTLGGIAFQAFLNCSSLKEVTFPEGLHTINRYAFWGTGITKVTLPKSLIELGDHAFPENTVIVNTNTELEDQGDGSYKVTYKVPIKATYDYSSAFQVLNLVNKERSAEGLSPLTMDKDLLAAAMTRAVETSVYFSHDRPTGADCFSICSSKMNGENIAIGQGSASGAMNSWMMSSGHKANILGQGYTSIGVGAVVVNGMRYWVQAFGSAQPDSAASSQYQNSTSVTQVKICLPKDDSSFRIIAGGDTVLDIGETGEAYLCIYNTFVSNQIDPAYVAFSSSAPAVCSVSSKGVLTGLKAGNATITLSVKSSPKISASFTVKVTSAVSANVKLAAPKLKSAVSAGYNAVKVTWEKVPYAQSYTLYYKGGSVKKWTKVKSGITGTSYKHVSGKSVPLTTGTTYSYTVKAVRGSSVSSANNTGVSAKPVPATVKLGKVTSAAYNKLKITWKKVAGASGYVVSRKVNGKWKKVADVKNSVTSYTHKNSKACPVLAGTINTYTVRAYRTVGKKKVYGGYSNTGIQGKAVLTKPSLKVSKTSKGLKLQWKKISGASGYVIQRYENSKWVNKETLKGSKTLTYTDRTAKKGTAYKYRVAAYRTVNKKQVLSAYSAAKNGKR